MYVMYRREKDSNENPNVPEDGDLLRSTPTNQRTYKEIGIFLDLQQLLGIYPGRFGILSLP